MTSREIEDFQHKENIEFARDLFPIQVFFVLFFPFINKILKIYVENHFEYRRQSAADSFSCIRYVTRLLGIVRNLYVFLSILSV
jgi:hypothetical protein